MMNWCEGLTLRAGGAARSDCEETKIDRSMKIVRQMVFIL